MQDGKITSLKDSHKMKHPKFVEGCPDCDFHYLESERVVEQEIIPEEDFRPDSFDDVYIPPDFDWL